ncbi:hypothetical protein [Ruegeria sp.]|uniref:hypothetical protein n=1 Tax=Ruegeria sp. TaxID=1879320 RepID=UPI003B58B58F
MFNSFWALGFSLIPVSAAAYSGPFSYLEKLDCVITEKCDFQKLCEKTNEQTEIIISQLVYEEPFSIEYSGQPWELVKDVESVAWIDFAHPTIRVPLPVWYQLEAQQEVGDPIEFRLDDWLSGSQVSPYDSHELAFVLLEEKSDISGKLHIKVCEKKFQDITRYRTYEVLCPLSQ